MAPSSSPNWEREIHRNNGRTDTVSIHCQKPAFEREQIPQSPTRGAGGRGGGGGEGGRGKGEGGEGEKGGMFKAVRESKEKQLMCQAVARRCLGDCVQTHWTNEYKRLSDS